jgi:hypothetical protein
MALAELVSTLAKHEVAFIIVGGMAAILRGTPVNTFDLDVVYERSAANIERLSRARVLKLERLIQIKQRLGRPKDQAMLPLLLATLDETNRSK